MRCEGHDDVTIWNNEVGPVDAGEDIVTCGDVVNNDDKSYQSWLGNYRSLKGTIPTALHAEGVSGVWTCITGGDVQFENATSNVTSVSNLQRYSQQSRPDYWDNYTAANIFTWTITYDNPETPGHPCRNYDTVQIIWLAPLDADAGADQISCGNDVNLNAIDEGAGAQQNWWTAGSAQSSNDEIAYTNPYWGGEGSNLESFENHVPVAADSDEQNAYKNPKYIYKNVYTYTEKVNFKDDTPNATKDSIGA